MNTSTYSFLKTSPTVERSSSSSINSVLRLKSVLVLLAAVLGLLLSTNRVVAQVESFSPVYSVNTEGNIYIIGNVNVTCASSGTCTSAQGGAVYQDNDFNSVYVDVDGDATTSNSSTANFTKSSTGTVLFAALFWGGVAPGSGSLTQAKFAVPGGSYQTITGTVNSTSYGYRAYANVTSLVQAGPGTGTYKVGNVPLAVGGTNQFGGWALVIVIRDTTDLFRNLKVYKGFDQVESGHNIDLAISGFKTPPAGPINTQLGFVVFDGDMGGTVDATYGRDSLKLNTTYLYDAVNPINDIFNSSISRLGSNLTAKNPNYVNNLGLDIDVIDASNILNHGDTSCTFRMTTGGETYIPFCITTSIQLYSPIMTINKVAHDVNLGFLEPSDTILYTIQVDNSGYDAATYLTLYDSIPEHTIYVPGSISVTKGANTGSKTDALADDQADYDAAGNRIVIRIATGANNLNGGTMAPSETTMVQFKVRVDPNTLDSTYVHNRAYLNYNSLQFGTAFADAGIPSLVIIYHPVDLQLTQTVTTPNPQIYHRDTIAVTVKNLGTYDADSVSVTNTFPSGLEYLTWYGARGTYYSGINTWKVGPLPVGDSAILYLVVRPNSSSSLTNSGYAIVNDTDKSDPALTNNSASVTITTVPDVIVPPGITLVTPADGDTTNATPTFSGTTEPDIFVIVKVDGVPVDTVVSGLDGTWSMVSSPLATGNHSVTVQAVDRAGNTSGLITHNFYVDATPPSVLIINPPDGSHTSNTHPPINGTAEVGCTVILSLDGVPVDTFLIGPGGTWSYTPVTALSDGPHTASAIAIDAVGNTATDSNPFTVDTIAPAIYISSPVNGSTISNPQPQYQGRTEPFLTVIVKVDGIPIDTVVADASGNWSAPQPVALADGPHTVSGTVTDAAGNTATATNAFTVDTSFPAVDVVTPANGSATSNTTPTITGTTDPNLTVIISIDGVVIDTIVANGAGNWSLPLTTPLSSGLHTASATAINDLGNRATDANVFTVITSPPTVHISYPANGSTISNNQPLYTGTTEPYNTVIVKVDGTPIDTVYADVNGNWNTPQPTALANGAHAVNATAIDGLGQTATTTNTFTINTSAPIVDVVYPADGSTISTKKPDYIGTTYPHLTVIVSVDGSAIDTLIADANGNWTTPQPVNLADGMHTISARAIDSLGQYAVDANIFYVDTAPPAIVITTPANGSITTNPTPPIYGSTEPYLEVIVKIDGIPIDTVTADGAGNWSTVPPSPLADGPHTVTATTEDRAGNTATTTNTFTVDATPPAIVITYPVDGSTIADVLPTYTGTTEPNLVVVVKVDGISIGTVTADGTGHWSIAQPTSLSDGPHQVNATTTDAAGNTATTTNSFSIDTTPPTVVITTPADGSLTNDPTPPITGTTEPNLTVIVLMDGVPIDTVVADGTGAWSTVQPTPLSNGPHAVTAIATDPSGNSASTTNNFTVDTIPPSIFITSPPEGSTTSNPRPPYIGRTEPGLTVTVTVDGIPIGTVVADNNGYWTKPQPTDLANGPHTVTATTTDAAGNSATDTHHFTVDTSAPTVDVVTPANGSVTTNNTPTIIGTTNPNLTVVVSIDGVVIDTIVANGSGNWSLPLTTPLSDGIHTASALAIDALGRTATDANVFTVVTSTPTIVIDNPANGSIINDNQPPYIGTTQPYLRVIVKVDGSPIDTVFADVNGNWTTPQPTPLANGSHTVSATAYDAYGNTANASNTFTINTSVPNVDVVTPANGSTIADRTPDYIGTTDPYLTVIVSVDGTPIDTVVADSYGNWSTVQPTNLSEGMHTVSAKATDSHGQFAIDANTFTIDSVPPTVTITTPADGSHTNDNTPIINGTTEPFLQVVIKMDGVPIDTVTADGNGNWSTVQPTPLSEGPHAVTATATDRAGNSATTTNNFIVDTLPPAIVITYPVNGSTIANNLPVYTGTTEPNLPVLVKVDGVTIGTVISDGTGHWTIPQPSTLADGSHSVNATATDAAGNTATTTNTFNIDTTPPTVVITTPANGSLTNDPTPPLTGTTEPNLTVIVLMDGVPIDTVVADGTGAWSTVQPTPLNNGPHAVTAIATDPSGNSATTTNNFTVDTIPPSIFITTPTEGSVTSNPRPPYNGRTEPGLTVIVTVDGTPIDTVLADDNGYWTAPQPVDLPNGPHTVTATTTDAAGNTATDTHHFTIDTTAPLVDVVTPANGSVTTNNLPTITGTTNPNLTVVVSIDGVIIDTITADGSGNWSLPLTSPLSDGIHTANALAIDNNGRTATDANVFTVATSFPTIVIDNPANGSIINDPTPPYIGTTQPYLRVIVKVDGSPIDTLFADVNGNWTTNQPTALSSGVHTVTATAYDAYGHTANATNTFTINTSVPNVDVVTPANGSTTADRTPDYIGTTDPYLTVIVSIDGTPIDTVVADAYGNWSTTQLTNLSDGMHTVSAKAIDPHGLYAIDANTFYIDSTPPTVTITTPANGSRTNDNTPIIYGTTEPFLQVVIKMDGVPIDTVTADGNGRWSTVQPTPLSEGPHAVTATATDRAGNSATTTNNFTVDTVPPTIVITYPVDGSTISINTPTYTGTTEPNLPVVVKVDGTTIGTVMSDGTGHWTIPQPTALAEGLHHVNATVTDPAGNTATTTNAFTVDTTPPVIAIVTPANGSVTSNKTPAITGTTEPNLTVIVTMDGVPIDTVVADGAGNWSTVQPVPLTDGPHIVTATTTDIFGRSATDTHTFTVDTIPPNVIITSPVDSTISTVKTPTFCGTAESGSTVVLSIDGTPRDTVVTDGTGHWCAPITSPLSEGPHTVVAVATDHAGNQSSDTNLYTVDTTPPTISIVTPANGDTTGSRPTIDGTTEANITVIVYVDGVPIDTVQSNSSGIWTTVQPTPLATGTHTAYGKAIDHAGNTVISSTHTFYVDATPPAIVILNPPDNSYTNDNTPTYTGTTEPYLPVIVKVDGVPIDTVTADASGNWSTTQPTPLTDGPHTVTATATDPYGNSATDTNPFTVDTVLPAVAITGPVDGTITPNNRIPITGTATPGSTVILKIDGIPVDTILVGPAGTWTYTPPVALADGPHTAVATATDLAGNTVTSPVDHFVVDTVPPPISLTSPAAGDTTSDNTPDICGTTDPGARIIVKVDNTLVDTVFADGTGHWCVTAPVLGDGSHTITVVARDSAGNTTTYGPSGTGFRVNTKPVLSSLGPSSRLLCDGDLALTVNGSNFFANSIVRVNGVDQPTTYVSATKLTAAIPATVFTAAGTYNITVYTPPPGGGTTASKPLTVSGASTFISGTVFYDRNISGSKDLSEPGITGWIVTLTAPDPANNQTMATQPGGVYKFENLYPGSHTITVTPATGWNTTIPASGSATASVSCGSGVTGVNFGYILADSTSDTGSYRTFIPSDLLTSKAVKKTCHMLRWNFTFRNSTGRPATGLYMEYNNIVTRWLNYEPFTEPVDLGQNAQDYRFYGTTIDSGEAMQISGFSEVHPCQIRVNKWWWLYNDSSTSKRYSEGPLNPDSITKYLPMPNAANVRDEVFRQAFSQMGGLLVGSPYPRDKKNYAWVIMKTSKDFLSSLGDNTGTHTGRARGFTRDLAQVPDLKGLLRTLPPRKHNNKLFADLAILHFNVAASAVGITPVGFGELIYDDGANPFSGLTIKRIAGIADTAMTFWRGRSEAYFIALDTAIQKINAAFQGTIDTISFSTDLRLTGVKRLSNVPFLRANPGASVTRMARQGEPDFVNTEVPERFEVYQNYPNPFNPTTQIGFYLPASSKVTVKIYDLLGKEVMTMLDAQDMDPGEQTFEFNGANFPSGVYFYRVSATVLPDEESDLSGKTYVQTKKMMILK